MNAKDLIDFETDIFNNYSEGKIKAPVHLTGSIDGHQEEELIKIFKKIKSNDWVFSTHRSHYISLLKSQDREWVKGEIFAKRSSHINSKYHKIFTSAIVGGNLPIALGTAMGVKRNWDNNIRYVDLSYMDEKKKILGKCMGMPHVWCFCGDMAANMGIMWECLRYAKGNKLPITFIVEDNGLGVYTPTQKVWKDKLEYNDSKYLYHYKYKRKYPHYGVGKWVTF